MKIAVVAVLAGLMMTVAIIAAVIPPYRERSPTAAATQQGDPIVVELERCRAATEPDDACERAWAERQRRFFGREGKGR